jgi:hypothetical protein
MLMVIGLSHPNITKKSMSELVQKSLDEFKEKTGGIRCHEFVLKDQSNEGPAEAHRKEGVCEKLVETAALIAKKYLP